MTSTRLRLYWVPVDEDDLLAVSAMSKTRTETASESPLPACSPRGASSEHPGRPRQLRATTLSANSTRWWPGHSSALLEPGCARRFPCRRSLAARCFRRIGARALCAAFAFNFRGVAAAYSGLFLRLRWSRRPLASRPMGIFALIVGLLVVVHAIQMKRNIAKSGVTGDHWRRAVRFDPACDAQGVVPHARPGQRGFARRAGDRSRLGGRKIVSPIWPTPGYSAALRTRSPHPRVRNLSGSWSVRRR